MVKTSNVVHSQKILLTACSLSTVFHHFINLSTAEFFARFIKIPLVTAVHVMKPKPLDPLLLWSSQTITSESVYLTQNENYSESLPKLYIFISCYDLMMGCTI